MTHSYNPNTWKAAEHQFKVILSYVCETNPGHKTRLQSNKQKYKKYTKFQHYYLRPKEESIW